MRGRLKLSDLPKEMQVEARKLAGMRPAKERDVQPGKGSNRIPASWVNHRRTCGWTGSIGPCIYCAEEGVGDVEATGRVDSP